MNSASIFIQQSSNFQFLSVCHYINVFGIFFHNKNLTTIDELNQTIPILNTLFEYFHKSKNESEAKLQLLQIVLKETDLYGGGENETLDRKYVDETYQYIISEALFFHYGNINGYLAGIINKADNVNYFALRKKVIHKLHQTYITRDYCSLSNGTTQLTKLAFRKVFEDHIWSIFPQPEQDMSIIDVNYIYAMVGLKIVRSVAIDVVDLKFHEYILISREIDLQQFNNETYEIALKLYSTPALFLYAYKLKDKNRKMEELRTRNQFVLNDEFWSEAYEHLFSYISNSVQETVNKGIENSLHYKLDKEINNLMSRTLMAYEILKVFCHYDNVAQVSELHVGIYKTFFHWITKLLLPSRCNTDDLPKLDDVYEDQFTEVEKIYNQIEQNAITNVLIYGKLVERMNANVSVLFARVPDYQQGCTYCPPPPRSKNKDIYLLFAIKEGKKNDFYAFRQESNTLSLLTSNGNEREFAQVVANDASLKMEIAIVAHPLKLREENYKMFVERVAEIKTKQFLKRLKENYYDEALGEKFLNFFKSLIPFYGCVESIRVDDKAGAALSCTLDILSLLPIAGFAAKYTIQLGSSLAKEIGNHYLITNSLAKLGTIVKVPIITALNQITKTAVRTVAREILTRGFLKDFALASLRSVDPGFELFYQVSNFGFKTFCKLLRNIIANFRNIPVVAKILSVIKNIIRTVKKSMNLISDYTGLVPLVLAEQDGFNIVRYLYPGGSNPFGPTCLTSYGRTAELRSIEGYPFEIAVMPVKSPGDVTAYKQYIPETGRILDTKLHMGGNDILRRVGYLLDKMLADGHEINLLRNYDVYHNTVHWKKALLDKNSAEMDHPEQNLQNLNSQSNPNHPNVAEFSRNERGPQREHSLSSDHARIQGATPQDTLIYYPPLFNPEFQVTLRGNIAGNLGHNFPPMANIEFTGTLSGSLGDSSNLPGLSREISDGVNTEVRQTLKKLILSRQSGSQLSKLSVEVENPISSRFLESEVSRTLIEKIEVDPYSANPKFSMSLKDLLLTGENSNYNSLIHKSVSDNANINSPEFSELPKTKGAISKVEYNFPQSVTPKNPRNLKGFSQPLEDASANPVVQYSNIPEIPWIPRDENVLLSKAEDSAIPQKKRRVDDSMTSPEIPVHYKPKIPNLDDVSGTSRQFVTNPNANFYRSVINEPSYTRYVEILMMLKTKGLRFIKQDKVKINFLRTSLSKLAAFQTDVIVPIKFPNELWCTDVVSGQVNIDFLRSLKGSNFFFNDITLLTNKPPGTSTSSKLDPFSLQTEIRYHLTVDSPNGFLDLTNFHDEFRNNYIVFNDLIFTVTNTYFTNNKNILIVELSSQGMSQNLWQYFRELDISNLLQEGRIIETTRMRRITNAACFMSDNAPLCTFRTSKNFLKNFILSTKQSSSGRNIVPTYAMLAEDFKNMEFRYSYKDWSIKSHPHIDNVLFNYNLDDITELSEAKGRIHDIYGSVYYQDIQEAFEKYSKTRLITQRLRFEDYYVLYSYVKNKLLTSRDGVRRFEAAIIRLSLRQCEMNEITKPITLYRGEMIDREFAKTFLSLQKDIQNIIVFDQLKKFSPQESVEMVNILNKAGTSSQIPLLMEITLNNQAGVADVAHVLEDGCELHVVTADFEFTLDEAVVKEIQGQEVLLLRMHDFESLTEKRMVQMAKKLDKLFSTDTKYYSDQIGSTF